MPNTIYDSTYLSRIARFGWWFGHSSIHVPHVIYWRGFIQSGILDVAQARPKHSLWIFATLSLEILIDVHDSRASSYVWDKLNRRFMHSSMVRALELKRMLTNIRKSDTQTMDAYLCEIKSITDNLSLVTSSVSSTDLVHYTLMGLSQEYETLMTTLTPIPMQINFDDIHSCLLLHGLGFRFLDGEDHSVAHPALLMHQMPQSQPTQSPRNNNTERNHCGVGCNNRNRRGRGGGYYNNHNNYNNNNSNSCTLQSHRWPRNVSVSMGVSNSIFSYFDTCSPSCTNISPIGNASQSRLVGSYPINLTCQICFQHRHSALQCPRFSSSLGQNSRLLVA